MTLSIAVALLLGEGLVRWLAPQDLSGTFRVEAPRGYALNRAGGTSRMQRGDRVVSLRFNEHHLRGGPLGPGRHRVLALGDSYTFGWLLEEEDTFVARLARRSDDTFGEGAFEWLNGGAGGWGTADHVAFVEDFGERLRPDVVVVFMNAEDPSRSVHRGIYRVTDARTLAVESLGVAPAGGRLKRLVNALPFYQLLLERSHLLQVARKAALAAHSAPAVGPADPAAGEAARTLCHALFRRLDTWCRDHGARLVVLTTGFVDSHAEVAGPGWEAETNLPFLRQAEAILAAEGIPFVDLAPAVMAAAGGDLEPYRIPGDGHPNEAGAELIARASWPVLAPHLAAVISSSPAP
jgi:lysophospholipase L1-like esterase